MTEAISVKSGLALELSKLQKNTHQWNIEVWKEIDSLSSYVADVHKILLQHAPWLLCMILTYVES